MIEEMGGRRSPRNFKKIFQICRRNFYLHFARSSPISLKMTKQKMSETLPECVYFLSENKVMVVVMLRIKGKVE